MLSKIRPIHLLIIGLVFLFFLNLGLFFVSRHDRLDVVGETGETGYLPEEVSIDQISSDDFSLGNGHKEIVVYDDPSSYFAPEYYRILKDLIKERDDITVAIRLIAHDNKLRFNNIARALICGSKQDKFFEMYEELMLANKEERLGSDYKFGASSSYSLDMERLLDCIASDFADRKIDKWAEEASRNVIIGVPSTVIDGKLYPGKYSLEDFTDSGGYERRGLLSIINEELK